MSLQTLRRVLGKALRARSRGVRAGPLVAGNVGVVRTEGHQPVAGEFGGIAQNLDQLARSLVHSPVIRCRVDAGGVPSHRERRSSDPAFTLHSDGCPARPVIVELPHLVAELERGHTPGAEHVRVRGQDVMDRPAFCASSNSEGLSIPSSPVSSSVKVQPMSS